VATVSTLLKLPCCEHAGIFERENQGGTTVQGVEEVEDGFAPTGPLLQIIVKIEGKWQAETNDRFQIHNEDEQEDIGGATEKLERN
jgi:hypothetical protein